MVLKDANVEVKKISKPGKRGRKPKPKTDKDNVEKKIPKKRGRKPKGGKLVNNNDVVKQYSISKPNIILHLNCKLYELNNNDNSLMSYKPSVDKIDAYQFDKKDTLPYKIIDNPNTRNNNYNIETNKNNVSENVNCKNYKLIWDKLKTLSYNLHTNNISDKKSSCFWCTCSFDSPPIHIPKFKLDNTYKCYGNFCSPECGVAFLFDEHIDTSTKFERFHLMNHIYCKIYDYKKNIKPAPNPYYTLDKFMGNLSIQEYRKLLENERLLLVVDKPLSRSLPELYEDNDDFIIKNSVSSFKIRGRTKTSKKDILSQKFNVN